MSNQDKKKSSESSENTTSGSDSCTFITIAGVHTSSSDNSPGRILKVGENLNFTKLLEYPKHSDKGSFQPDWSNKFKWLEYSRSRDVVFCYPCRQPGHSEATKRNAFLSTGYGKWRNKH